MTGSRDPGAEDAMADFSGARTLGGSSGAEKWQLAEGDTLGGYRVVRPLGRGGMGEVCIVGIGHTSYRHMGRPSTQD